MKKYLFLLVFSFHFCVLFSQKNVIDKVVAIVGEEIILKSDIENAFLQEQGRGLISSSANYRTELLEQQLIQKLLLAQAQVDSISEVRAYFKKLPKDSLPDMPDRYELQQIVLRPNISDAEKERIREQLREYRDQIQKGEKTFNTIAVLYSEDGSATRGGELGYMRKQHLA